jgi:hypothetical protein
MVQVKRSAIRGLVVVMALAIAAVIGVAGASASTLEGSYYPYKVSGTSSEQLFLKSEGGLNRTCDMPTFTSSAEFSQDSTGVFAATPQSSINCNPEVKLTTNDCKLIFHVGSKIETGRYAGTMDIGASNCAGITLTNYVCPMTIIPQDGIPVTFTAVGSGSSAGYKISVSTGNLKYTQSNCDSKIHEHGVLTGAWLAQGIDLSGNSEGIFLSGDAPEKHFPFFYEEAFPMTEKTTQDESNRLVIKTGTGLEVKCMGPGTYEGCKTSFGTSTKFKLNSCSAAYETVFSWAATSATYPYTSTANLACSKSSIEVNMGFCIMTIGYQPGLKGAEFVNTGSGSTHQVRSSVAVSGFKYTVTNVFACPAGLVGTFEDGSLSNSLNLSGYDEKGAQVGYYLLD